MSVDAPPPFPDSAAPATPPESPGPALSLWLRGLEVRLRFFLALGLLAALMLGWPWLRAGWETLSARWRLHAHAAAVSADTEFFCPMDPGVLSAWPAICPICNMDLIPRKKGDAVLLPEGVVARMQISPYRVQLAGVRTVPAESRPPSGDEAAGAFAVPATAVVRLGGEYVVYVETMPGMFDGVRVDVAARDGDAYVIRSGVKAGQRVVAAGAFLVDAETRLNANVATQYFGASGQTAASAPPPLPQRRGAATQPPLSASDQALATQQRICPVTEAPLGSMGQPVWSIVQGRKVFLCCKACESALQAEPEKFLARLAAPPAEPAK